MRVEDNSSVMAIKLRKMKCDVEYEFICSPSVNRFPSVKPFIEYMEDFPPESTLYVEFMADEMGNLALQKFDLSFSIDLIAEGWGWTQYVSEWYQRLVCFFIRLWRRIFP